MIKYTFSLLLILISVTLMAQKKSVVNLIESRSSERVIINGQDVLKVYKGVFKHDYSILRADSSYFYIKDNAVDAFDNVNINQGDTLNIFSDKLNYNGNTKIAILTNNVKMVDKDATLTTDYLTYNTATRIGTYTGGGKLVNKDNTLTSKNGYYFAYSRDSYFRYNVVLVTPDALIKTDTLRYNTNSRIAYFYGPTNIYDTKDKKDTLYTENGLYNTITEQAFFGKKNLYKQGTKRLKGDSLFYDRKIGYGQAIKHVVFTDSEQKITLFGDLANYYKAEERTVVTKDPYVVLVTEEKDTTKTDTIPVAPVAKDKDKKVASPIKAPSLSTAPKNTAPVTPLKMPPLGTPVKAPPLNSPVKAPPLGTPVKALSDIKRDTTLKPDSFLKADSLLKGKPKEKIKTDSVYISADTLDTQVLTVKAYKDLLEKVRLSRIRDTTIKVTKPGVKAKADKFLVQTPPRFMNIDTGAVHPLFFGKPKPVAAPPVKLDKDGKPIAAKAPPKKPATDDEVENDPAFIVRNPVLSDTARIRIVRAYHHAKLFKSDLQAKADSMFYSYGDSTLRCYVNPIIWAQGSQLSGDTINLQMKNKKMDNMMMFPSSFIVNIEKDDSTHFNQVAGKRMRGFFKDSKLDRMFISGNAESIYFSRDSGKVSGMERSLSTRMRVLFKDNSATDIFFLVKPEQRYGPLEKFTEDERILKGFIWKPKERPISKESIIPSYNKKTAPAKSAPGKKPATGKLPGVLPAGVNKLLGDSVLNKLPGNLPGKALQDSLLKKIPGGKLPSKAATDSLLKMIPVKLPAITGKDSLLKKIPAKLPSKTKADSLLNKALGRPPVKTIKKDTTKVKATP